MFVIGVGIFFVILFFIIAIICEVQSSKEKKAKEAEMAKQKARMALYDDAIRQNEETDKLYDVLDDNDTCSKILLDAWKEFLEGAKEPYRYVKYYNSSFFDHCLYNEKKWEQRIALNKGRYAVVSMAFKKWEEKRRAALLEKQTQEAEELAEKAFSGNSLKKYYEEYKKNLPTTDLKKALDWQAEGKKVFMRPVHPGIPSIELGKDSWVAVDFNAVKQNDCFEFDYEERINKRGY